MKIYSSCDECGVLEGQMHREGCLVARIQRTAHEILNRDTANEPTYPFIKSTIGLKYDENKQPWYALPLEVLEPLADVFAAGEKKYDTFNCLLPFEDSKRRFYDGQMRHTRASQRNTLAIDKELREKYGVEVYHLAQIAFNCLMRLYHARKEAGLINSDEE